MTMSDSATHPEVVEPPQAVSNASFIPALMALGSLAPNCVKRLPICQYLVEMTRKKREWNGMVK